jgi:hypothetical protein
MTLGGKRQFAVHSIIAKTAILAGEKLLYHHQNHAVKRVLINAHTAHNPSVVVRDTAPRHHPAQAQEAVICAILFKRQVRGFGLEVGWVKVEIWEAQLLAPFPRWKSPLTV